MSKKQWLVLLMLFLTYLLLGASIFYHIESRLEIEKINKARQERIEINALLHEHYFPNGSHNQHEILRKLTEYCGKSVYNYTDGETDPLKWDFYNSFYFAYTVVSTIGYGNLAPTNMLDRILMIIYGLVGIPMNGILLTQLGEFFGDVFVKAHKKYKTYKLGQSDSPKKLTPLETRKAGLAAQIFMYLTPGFVMFIFFPAFLFSYYEGWSYDEAVYYAFVTLTTIGFGDYVAGQDNTKGSGVFFILYKIFLICWISFGLGYIVMIMTFIGRGMKSKKIIRIEHKLAMNLKHTQSKIWNEFNKEVNYLRRVFNELQLSKVKRVYVDEYNYETPPAKFPHSNSFPDLRDLIYGGLATPSPPHPRRRANSEVVPVECQVTRVVSETDLQRIDKTATFASHAMVQPAELLARLINVLGYIPPPSNDHDEAPEQGQEQDAESKGIQGFSDKEILANERFLSGSGWRIGTEKIPIIQQRSRTASEARLGAKHETHQQNGEWTWSGPAASKKIQELIKARSGMSNSKDVKTKFPSLTLSSVPKVILPRWMKSFSNKKSSSTRSRANSLSVDSLERRAVKDNYPWNTAGNNRFLSLADRHSLASRNYFTHTGTGNLPSSPEGRNLLEQTTLADFLRSLTALHSSVDAIPNEYIRKPQRKMGTASLTPPKLPSLLALFSPPTAGASTHQSYENTITAGRNVARRLSLRTAEHTENSTSNYCRRGSLIHSAKPRRFSLRSVATPGGTSPQHASPCLSDIAPRCNARRYEPPSYSTDSYMSESPKEPLVSMEGAPGVSSPVTSSSNLHRFSLRPAQLEVPPASASSNATPASIAKPLPRWKAGMLERHINEMNLQRRARAFSLSDVYSDKSGRNLTFSPLAMNDSRNEAPRKVTAGGQKELSKKSIGKSSALTTKVVTIVPPDTTASNVSDVKEYTVGQSGDLIFPQSSVGDINSEVAASQLRTEQEPLLKTVLPSQQSISQITRQTFSSTINPFDASLKSVVQRSLTNTNPFVSEHMIGVPISSNVALTSTTETPSSKATSSSSSHSTVQTEIVDNQRLAKMSSSKGTSLELQSVVIDKPLKTTRPLSRALTNAQNNITTEPVSTQKLLNPNMEDSLLMREENGTEFRGNINFSMLQPAEHLSDNQEISEKKLRQKEVRISEAKVLNNQQTMLGEPSVTDKETSTGRKFSVISQCSIISSEKSITDVKKPTSGKTLDAELRLVSRKVPTISAAEVMGDDEKSVKRKVSEAELKSTNSEMSMTSQRSTVSMETLNREDDEKSISRKRSTVSIGPWIDNQKPKSRKVSMISQQSTSAELTSNSRKSSTNKSPGDKPRVSIDSYKPLMEIKIEKPSTNPFEQYRATVEKASQDNNRSLMEVKVESLEESSSNLESKRKILVQMQQQSDQLKKE